MARLARVLVPLALATPAAVALVAPAPASAGLPPFASKIERVPAPIQRRMKATGTWRVECPVRMRDLRLLTVRRVDFGGRARWGWLVVHEDAAVPLRSVFRTLYRQRFPIRRMLPVDRYGSPPDNDFRSIEADNTSAFNCRNATGSGSWSQHAYGLAVDLNPIENPYVSGGRTSHPRSEPYLDRSRVRPGMVVEGDVVVRAFARVGWGWGGRWSNPIDYQHFSSSGG